MYGLDGFKKKNTDCKQSIWTIFIAYPEFLLTREDPQICWSCDEYHSISLDLEVLL